MRAIFPRVPLKNQGRQLRKIPEAAARELMAMLAPKLATCCAGSSPSCVLGTGWNWLACKN